MASSREVKVLHFDNQEPWRVPYRVIEVIRGGSILTIQNGTGELGDLNDSLISAYLPFPFRDLSCADHAGRRGETDQAG